MSLIPPLELERSLQTKPTQRLNIAALADIIVIAVFFILLGSHYLTPAGLSIDLPTTDFQQPAYLLPTATATVANPNDPLPDISVASIKQDNMMLFEGRITNVANLENQMTDFLAATQPNNPVLLLKISRDVSVQILIDVVAAAHKAGFEQVQLATEPESRSSSLLNE